jgi:hypothetical protein
MEKAPNDSPGIPEIERLIDQNCKERDQLIEQESGLRAELQSIIRKRMPVEDFEELRARERETRAGLSRNLDQYDVLMEKWAEEVSRIELSSPPAPGRADDERSTRTRSEVASDSRPGSAEHRREHPETVEKQLVSPDTTSAREIQSLEDRIGQKIAVPLNAMVRNAGLDLVPLPSTPVNALVAPTGPGKAAATFGSRLPEAPKPVFHYPLDSD